MSTAEFFSVIAKFDGASKTIFNPRKQKIIKNHKKFKKSLENRRQDIEDGKTYFLMFLVFYVGTQSMYHSNIAKV